MGLIPELNRNRGSLLPAGVKKSLKQSMLRQKGLNLSGARNTLLHWTVASMPEIANEYRIPGQVLDGLQHYRFGMVQAQRLIDLSGTKNFVEDPDRKMVALFTSVHDLGRMMVGSPASRDIYPDLGGLLHPVVGAMMLREAFNPLYRDLPDEVGELLSGLIATAERHTISLGLLPSTASKAKLTHIRGYERHSGLLLTDANMGKFGRYAHLIALADLINNANAKLERISSYDSLVGLKAMDVNQRIRYLLHGPGSGNFAVVKSGEDQVTAVDRCWKNDPGSPANFDQWIGQMRKDATRFAQEDETELAGRAFDLGVERAFR